MSETKLLQMSNITKAFASNVVLNGVDISVDEGEVVAILYRKSTVPAGTAGLPNWISNVLYLQKNRHLKQQLHKLQM